MQVRSKIKLLFIYEMLKVKVQPKLKVDTFPLVVVIVCSTVVLLYCL